MCVLKYKGQIPFYIAFWVKQGFNIHVVKQIISEKILEVENVSVNNSSHLSDVAAVYPRPKRSHLNKNCLQCNMLSLADRI